MDSLLRWSIENSGKGAEDASAAPAAPRQPFNPDIIDAILGKSDADTMKENLAVALDESRTIEDRVTSLDNFEMRIESIDNALNITPLNMWEPLIRLSHSSEDEIKQYGLWILGTAIQNNPKAQHTYLSYNPLADVLAILKLGDAPQPSPQTRSKAVYCLSNSLKHNAQAVQQFSNLGGWAVLKEALHDSSIVVRRKVVFLLSALILQDGKSGPEDEGISLPPSIHTNLAAAVPSETETNTNGAASRAISSSGTITSLLNSLISPVPHGPDGSDVESDVDYEEKAVKTLLGFVQLGAAKLSSEEKKSLAAVLKKFGKNNGLERWSLTETEWKELESASRA